MSVRIAKRIFHPIHLLLAIMPIMAFVMWPITQSIQAGGKTKIDTPVIACGSATQTSINVCVTAPSGTGATGLPAGFTLQWMTVADYVANGNQWFTTGNPRYCDASFSGNANLSRYNLMPGQTVCVNVGEFLFDNGASTSCPNALVCGTAYVFRAFGHAKTPLNKSNWTANLTCSTLACGHNGGCTLTQGYWKTHGPLGCLTGNNTYCWPTLGAGVSLGNVHYTDDQLCSIFNRPAAGNGVIALAHQLISAKFNIMNGADGTALGTAIADADALIGNLVVPPVGGGYLSPASTSYLIGVLTSFNEGAIGPGHCE